MIIRKYIAGVAGGTAALLCYGGGLSPAWAADAPGRIYYVAPGGNDAGPGTARRPWKTVQKAADVLGAGDTVLIRGGVYHERVVARHSGTDTAPIRFRDAPGTPAILDGQGLPGGGVFDTNGQNGLELSGLTVRNALPSGVGIRVHGSRHVTITGCHVADCAWSGVLVEYSSQVRLAHSEITRACQTGGEETVSVARHTENCTITGCEIHHTGHEGIDVKEGAAHVRVEGNDLHDVERQGLYTDAWNVPTTDIRFTGNLVHDCGFGVAAGSEMGGPLSDVWFEDNVIYNNRGPGMVVADWGGKGVPHPVTGIHFVNNTVYHNINADGWGGGMYFENAGARDILVRNNVLSQNGIGQIAVIGSKRPERWTVDHNLLDGVGPDPGTDDIKADPHFVNAAAGDFHLRPGSPAISAGAPVDAPKQDRDGRPRHGAHPDLGAYSWRPSGAYRTLNVAR